MAPEILFTSPALNPYPTCELANPNFQCQLYRQAESIGIYSSGNPFHLPSPKPLPYLCAN